jgi:hypothetical protein
LAAQEKAWHEKEPRQVRQSPVFGLAAAISQGISENAGNPLK